MSQTTDDGGIRMSGTLAPSGAGNSPPKLPTLPTAKKLSMPYTLPSQGVFYGEALAGGVVVISPIKGEQEEILSGMGESPNAKSTLQHIVAQLVEMNGFPINKLLVGDYAALVMNVMAFSYDPYITATTQCPACKKNNLFNKPVSELECTRLTPEMVKNEDNYKVRLESVDAELTFRSLTMEDSELIERFALSHRAEAEELGSRPEYLYTFVRHITAINGVDASGYGDGKLRQWLGQLSGKDMAKFRAAMNKVEPGYNMRPTLVCGHCSNEYEVPLPEVSKFFRTKSAKARSA